MKPGAFCQLSRSIQIISLAIAFAFSVCSAQAADCSTAKVEEEFKDLPAYTDKEIGEACMFSKQAVNIPEYESEKDKDRRICEGGWKYLQAARKAFIRDKVAACHEQDKVEKQCAASGETSGVELQACVTKHLKAGATALEESNRRLSAAIARAKSIQEKAERNRKIYEERNAKVPAVEPPSDSLEFNTLKREAGAETFSEYRAKLPVIATEQERLQRAAEAFQRAAGHEVAGSTITQHEIQRAAIVNDQNADRMKSISSNSSNEKDRGLSTISSADVANFGAATSALGNAAKQGKDGEKSGSASSKDNGGVNPTTAKGSGTPGKTGSSTAEGIGSGSTSGASPIAKIDSTKATDTDSTTSYYKGGGGSGGKGSGEFGFSVSDRETGTGSRSAKATSLRGSGGGSNESEKRSLASSSAGCTGENCAKEEAGSAYGASGQLGASRMLIGGASGSGGSGSAGGKSGGEMTPEELLGLNKLQGDSPLTDEEKKWLGLDSDGKVPDVKEARKQIAQKMAAAEAEALERSSSAGGEISGADSPGLFARVKHMHLKAQQRGLVAGIRVRI